MRETALDEMFAEFEAEARTAVRPPGVADAQRRVWRRRRRRRGLLAGAAALLLGGPAGALAVTGRGDAPPPPAPTPTVTRAPDTEVTPLGRITRSRVALPGVAGRLSGLDFVDARTGWALFDTCAPNDPGATGCRRTLARTTDGGGTWQRTALPAEPTGAAYLLPVDGRTVTVVAGQRYLATTDGGATFTSHRFGAPPRAAQLAAATRSGFVTRCPGGNGLDDNTRDPGCFQKEFARVGAARLPTQPPVALRPDLDHQLTEGGDGRLWLAIRDDGLTNVLFSTDRAETWQGLPPVTGRLDLLVSPDGRDVWLSGTEAPKPLWRLSGDRWQETAGLPDDTHGVAALGGGMLMVTSAYGGAGFLADGRYIDRPELRDVLSGDENATAEIAVLRDGTIELDYGDTTVLGVGSGAERSWTWFS